ncbi:MAG: hypothetical protein HYV27_04980 [Candidatus Hydrogenedentes bacterium]|nr:hypothetical protein [Candidatus Hydrogenedentota bacterium]
MTFVAVAKGALRWVLIAVSGLLVGGLGYSAFERFAQHFGIAEGYSFVHSQLGLEERTVADEGAEGRGLWEITAMPPGVFALRSKFGYRRDMTQINGQHHLIAARQEGGKRFQMQIRIQEALQHAVEREEKRVLSLSISTSTDQVQVYEDLNLDGVLDVHFTSKDGERTGLELYCDGVWRQSIDDVLEATVQVRSNGAENEALAWDGEVWRAKP